MSTDVLLTAGAVVLAYVSGLVAFAEGGQRFLGVVGSVAAGALVVGVILLHRGAVNGPYIPAPIVLLALGLVNVPLFVSYFSATADSGASDATPLLVPLASVGAVLAAGVLVIVTTRRNVPDRG